MFYVHKNLRNIIRSAIFGTTTNVNLQKTDGTSKSISFSTSSTNYPPYMIFVNDIARDENSTSTNLNSIFMRIGSDKWDDDELGTISDLKSFINEESVNTSLTSHTMVSDDSRTFKSFTRTFENKTSDALYVSEAAIFMRYGMLDTFFMLSYTTFNEPIVIPPGQSKTLTLTWK